MNWKDYLHYGSSAVLVLIGVLGLLHVPMPGVTIDPETAIIAGLAGFGVFAGGLKSGWSGK